MRLSDLTLIALVLLVVATIVIRALVTGRSGFGAHGYDRRTQPAEFWVAICLMAIMVPLWLYFATTDEPWTPARIPPASIIVTPIFAFWLIRFLQKASVRNGVDHSNVARSPPPTGPPSSSSARCFSPS